MPQQLREFMIEGRTRRRGTGWPTRCGPGSTSPRTVRARCGGCGWTRSTGASTAPAARSSTSAARGMHELALVTADGERIAAAVPRMSWPRMAGAVPAGLVRERVAPIAGIRALLPGRREPEHTAHPARARRRGQDRSPPHGRQRLGAAGPGRRRAFPPRLTITPVRGYDAQAGRVERLLADLPA